MALVRMTSPFYDEGPILSGTMMNDLSKIRLPRIIVGVDESGDRNSKENRQSDFFTMTAFMVEEEFEDQARVILGGVKNLWRIQGQVHWVKHLQNKYRGRREILVGMLARLPGVQVIHVIVDKPALGGGARMTHDQHVQYNYITKLLHERIAQAARAWPGGERIAQVYYGLVGGIEPEETNRYLNHCAYHRDSFDIPWGNLFWPSRWSATSSRDILQIADLYSGIIGTAVRDGDASWLEQTRLQIYRKANGWTLGYGLKIYPKLNSLSGTDWIQRLRIVE